MTPDVKPFRDQVVLKFLESEQKPDSEDHEAPIDPSGGEEATIALVVAAGPESPAKKGDMVFVDPYTRSSGTRLGDDTRIVSSYHVLAKIVGEK